MSRISYDEIVNIEPGSTITMVEPMHDDGSFRCIWGIVKEITDIEPPAILLGWVMIYDNMFALNVKTSSPIVDTNFNCPSDWSYFVDGSSYAEFDMLFQAAQKLVERMQPELLDKVKSDADFTDSGF